MSIERLDKRFGTIAIEKGFIALDHLMEALIWSSKNGHPVKRLLPK